MNVYELAQKYYPRMWDLERLQTLVSAGKLSQEDCDAIVKEKDNG